MKIIKLLPCIVLALPLLTGCPSVGTSEAVISIVSITPPPGSAIEEFTEIEAVLDYEMNAYEYVDYQITILFETTTGGYVVAGDNPSLEITLSAGQVTHMYTVSSMDVSNGVVKKPYEIHYVLEKSEDGEIWEEVAVTEEVTYTE